MIINKINVCWLQCHAQVDTKSSYMLVDRLNLDHLRLKDYLRFNNMHVFQFCDDQRQLTYWDLQIYSIKGEKR